MTLGKNKNDVKPSSDDGIAQSSGTSKRGNLANLRPFPPGQSGNPGGRMAIPPEVKRIFEAALPETARQLVALANSDPDPAIRLKAIEMIHNRLLGRPMQQIDAQVTTTNVQQAHLQVLIELQQKREQAMKTIEGTANLSDQEPKRSTKTEGQD